MRKKDFSDRDFNCKKCRARLALERFDRQCLIVGESLAFFNFCRFACLRCEAVNEWQAPNLLPDERTTLDGYPDRLKDLSKPDKRIVNQLGVFNGHFRSHLSMRLDFQ
jgi:ribosomal protein L40E